jgi:hypothetical protein
VTGERLTGGCLCGGVRYELEPPFRRANACHCSRCRRHSGSAFLAQGRVARKRFRLLQGAELVRTFRPEGRAAKAFCERCGSSLFGGDWPEGDEVSVRLGTLDDAAGVHLDYHSFVGSKAGWDSLPEDGLPRHEGAAPTR